MAPGYSDGNEIVRTWTDHRAPTGEGSMYQTRDGSVWRAVFSTPTLTGAQYANIRNGKMVPRP